MHIAVQRDFDRGMPENFRQAFYVHAAFHAAGGKRVPQGMKPIRLDLRLLQNALEIVCVAARFDVCSGPCQHVGVRGVRVEAFQLLRQRLGERDRALRILATDLFKNVYKTGEADNVKSTTDVIAPGTESSVKFKFEYDTSSNSVSAPEVAYLFTVDVDTTGSTTEKLDSNKSFKWTLDGTEYNTLSELVVAIKALSGSDTGSMEYKPGNLPEAFYGSTHDCAKEHTIGWKWLFDAENNTDTADTELGNMDELEKISIKITITATQVD